MVNFQNCGTHTILMQRKEAEPHSHLFSREYPEEKEVHRNESDINIGQGLSLEASDPGFGLSDKYLFLLGMEFIKVVEPIEDIDLVFEESSEIPDTLEKVEIGIQTILKLSLVLNKCLKLNKCLDQLIGAYLLKEREP